MHLLLLSHLPVNFLDTSLADDCYECKMTSSLLAQACIFFTLGEGCSYGEVCVGL